MKNNIFAKAAAALLAAAMVICLFSCSFNKADYTEEEIFAECESLIEKSFEINEIYFGKGLPTTGEAVRSSENSLVEIETDEENYDIEITSYVVISEEESPYTTEDEIRAAAAEVYTEDYCEFLNERAFVGIVSADGDTVAYTRFMYDQYGRLTQRADCEENSPLTGRTYDYSTMKLEKALKDEAWIKITSEAEGEALELRLTLKRENGVWRLDTPTY